VTSSKSHALTQFPRPDRGQEAGRKVCSMGICASVRIVQAAAMAPWLTLVGSTRRESNCVSPRCPALDESRRSRPHGWASGRTRGA
jgi:hypothetical protein